MKLNQIINEEIASAKKDYSNSDYHAIIREIKQALRQSAYASIAEEKFFQEIPGNRTDQIRLIIRKQVRKFFKIDLRK